MRESVIASVRQQVYNLDHNPVVREAACGRPVHLIGDYYEISSGGRRLFWRRKRPSAWTLLTGGWEVGEA